MRRFTRLCIGAAAVAATWTLPGLVSPASAVSSNVKPTIGTQEAQFAIPAGSNQAWLLRLWSLPAPSTLEGWTIGASGTISVLVPATQNCEFQVDVKVAPPGTTDPKLFKWYSGLIATVAGCGHCPAGGPQIHVNGTTVHGTWANTHVKPTLTGTLASFTIPATGPPMAWIIRLWTLPAPSTLEGQLIGSSGTLTLNVPATQNCQFQVDVKTAPPGTTDPKLFKWYSGVIATV